MKKLSYALALFVLLFANAKINAQTDIEITAGNVKINGVDIKFPWTFASITNSKVLGKEDRSDLGGGNDIFTYDSKGIILYRPPSSNNVSDFNIYYGKDPNDNYSFNPTGLYKGSFKVEGFSIMANTSLARVQTGLSNYAFVKSSIGAYRGEYKGLYIYLQYDDTEKNIYWISVGKKK